MCNPFSPVRNSFPRIGNSTLSSPVLHFVPSNCLMLKSRDRIAIRDDGLSKSRSEETDCLIRGNELIICENGFSIYGNGLNNSI